MDNYLDACKGLADLETYKQMANDVPSQGYSATNLDVTLRIAFCTRLLTSAKYARSHLTKANQALKSLKARRQELAEIQDKIEEKFGGAAPEVNEMMKQNKKIQEHIMSKFNVRAHRNHLRERSERLDALYGDGVKALWAWYFETLQQMPKSATFTIESAFDGEDVEISYEGAPTFTRNPALRRMDVDFDSITVEHIQYIVARLNEEADALEAWQKDRDTSCANTILISAGKDDRIDTIEACEAKFVARMEEMGMDVTHLVGTGDEWTKTDKSEAHLADIFTAAS
jgi:hypothetical protein